MTHLAYGGAIFLKTLIHKPDGHTGLRAFNSGVVINPDPEEKAANRRLKANQEIRSTQPNLSLPLGLHMQSW